MSIERPLPLLRSVVPVPGASHRQRMNRIVQRCADLGNRVLDVQHAVATVVAADNAVGLHFAQLLAERFLAYAADAAAQLAEANRRGVQLPQRSKGCPACCTWGVNSPLAASEPIASLLN